MHPDIKPEQGDVVVEKSYADAFHNSTLDQVLKSLNITDLVITGLQTAYCVDTTCRRAFKAWVIEISWLAMDIAPLTARSFRPNKLLLTITVYLVLNLQNLSQHMK